MGRGRPQHCVQIGSWRGRPLPSWRSGVIISSGYSRPRPPATVRVGRPRQLPWVWSVLRLLHLALGAGSPQELSNRDPSGVVGHPGSGTGIPAHRWWSSTREAASSPGQTIRLGRGSEGTASTRARTRRAAEIYISAAEVHLRRKIPPPNGYQVWRG
jgi:hypothetical protein